MKETKEAKVAEILDLKNEGEEMTTEEFLADRKIALTEMIKGDKYQIEKYEQSIKTHETLIEVVEENIDRFEHPEEMIRQFAAINANFENSVNNIKTNIKKSEDLIETIDNHEDISALDVLMKLLVV